MKTIQISHESWKRLKWESVERGVPMRAVVEEAVSVWGNRTSGTVTVPPGVESVRSIRQEAERVSASFRELKVELEE